MLWLLHIFVFIYHVLLLMLMAVLLLVVVVPLVVVVVVVAVPVVVVVLPLKVQVKCCCLLHARNCACTASWPGGKCLLLPVLYWRCPIPTPPLLSLPPCQQKKHNDTHTAAALTPGWRLGW